MGPQAVTLAGMVMGKSHSGAEGQKGDVGLVLYDVDEWGGDAVGKSGAVHPFEPRAAV